MCRQSILSLSLALLFAGQAVAQHKKSQSLECRPAAVSSASILFQVKQPAAVFALAFSPGDRQIATGGRDGKVRLWDAKTGSLENTLTTPAGNRIATLEYLPGTQHFATGSYDHPDRELRLWDGAKGKELHRFGEGDPHGYIQSISISPRGTHLADSRRRIWNLKTLQAVMLGEPSLYAFSVCYSPAGKVAFATKNSIELWDPSTATQVASFRHAKARALAFTPQGKSLVSADGKGQLLRWDLQSGASRPLANHRGGVWSIAIHPGGKLLASGGNDHSVRIWDLRTGTLVTRFAVHKGSVRSLAFSHDGKRLAAGSYQDGLLVVWSWASGR